MKQNKVLNIEGY